MAFDTGPQIAISVIHKWADRLAHKAAHDALGKVHRILGDPGAVMATAKAWNAAGSLLWQSMASYSTATTDLIAKWEGTAHENFKVYMQDVQTKSNGNKEGIDAVATELLNSYQVVIDTYSKAIQEIGDAASKLNGLDGDSGGAGGKKAGWAAAADKASKILSSFAKGVSGWLSEGEEKMGKYSVSIAEIQKDTDRLLRPGSDPLV